MDTIRGIAETAIDSLGIAPSIRSIFVEKTDSPWNEKAFIKRKGSSLDVKITIWSDDSFLFGRIFRLFIYISDVLDPLFQYNPKITPLEDKEPGITARYNQIWSLYVDSRMERKGIESFFDKLTRRNLFIDMEKEIPWEEGDALFHRLWLKSSFSYPEIIYLSRNLGSLLPDGTSSAREAREVRIAASIKSPHVRDHIERIEQASYREMVNEILSFTAYYCKDCYITASYYGIYFLFQRRVFVELVPAADDLLYLTLLNPSNETFETETLTHPKELELVQGRIKKVYDSIAAQSRDQ
ncbi:MAG TPA: hypothetical protein VGJ94_15595 [Syntrophorhabdaceae bacterium]